jgi:hypothetical protein
MSPVPHTRYVVITDLTDTIWAFSHRREAERHAKQYSRNWNLIVRKDTYGAESVLTSKRVR